jgi:hypothetical protein
MVACPYGASVKPGIDPNAAIAVDRTLWEQVTGAAGSWADFLLNIVSWDTITASQLCGLNPDDPPLPSIGTIAAALYKDPAAIFDVGVWARDKLRYVAFSLN